MKKLYKYITILFLGIMIFTSCAEEELVSSFGENGTDVTLNLRVKTQDIKDIVVSRADNPAEVGENVLYDLHIYIFNASNRKLTGYKKIDFGKDGSIHQLAPNTYDVKVDTKSGESYIYALANIDSDNYKVNNLSLLNVTDVESSSLELDDFLAVKFTRIASSQGVNVSPTPSDNVFMMSGYLNQGNSINIPQSGNISDNIITLYRILAKNTIKINSTQYTTGKNRGKYAFTPNSYRFWNVPKWGVLVPKANINSVTSYINNNITIVDEEDSDGKIIKHIESGYRKYTSDTELVFYYPENLQVAKSDAQFNMWKDREKNNWEGGKKTYVNADDNASYIEIEGKYVSEDGNTTADVIYTIHLGDFSTATGTISDFNVIRNSHYKYTVNINGIEDIKVEAQRLVTADNDKLPVDNPYVEGIVINATSGRHFDVDAHYESRVMTFSKNSIRKLKAANNNAGNGYILNISTPFGKTPETLTVKKEGSEIKIYRVRDNAHLATYNPSNKTLTKQPIINEDGTTTSATVFDREEDYDWIKFVKNTKNNKIETVSETDISKYPCKYPGDGHETILNVFELLAELYYTDEQLNGENAKDVYKHSINVRNADGTVGTDYVAYYTCFIDENYYPTKQWDKYVSWHNASSSDPEAGKKNPRTMQIANNLDISSDGKSLYAEVEYSIAQRPISTVYSNSTLIAFGTEIIDEEDVYSNRLGNDNTTREQHLSNYKQSPIARQTEDGGIPTDIEYDDNWDAYTCAYYSSKLYDDSWYSSDDVSLKEGIQPLYSSVAKACMSRNRDLDGDGEIETDTDPEKNEVRWYLAAIDQYRTLFYAQSVLTSDAHFISDEEMTAIDTKGKSWDWGDTNGHNFRGKYHYWTCSDETTSATFWPEEGLTNNPTSDYTQGNWISRAELIRCVRTLQSEGHGLQNPVRPYHTDVDNDHLFILDGITVSRVKSEGQLIRHHERDVTNDFSTRFLVAKNDLVNSVSINNRTQTLTTNYATGPNIDPCTTYQEDGDNTATWRTPNQKEMALMLSKKGSLNILVGRGNNYLTRTGFSGSWHTSPGFGCEAGSINLTEHNSNARIRCVRDVDVD